MTRTKALDVALWAAVALIGLGIVVVSVTADPIIRGTQFPGADKVGHAIAYFTLTLLLLLAGSWRPGRAESLWNSAVPALLVAVAYGGILEVVQGAVGRDAQFLDLLADALGALLALAVWAGMKRVWGGESSARA